MATKLYLRDAASDYTTGTSYTDLASATAGALVKALSTAAGAAAVQLTTSTPGGGGPTNGVEVGTSLTVHRVWHSAPLDADITISGSVTWNIWGRENDMAANVAINGQLEVIDGATGAITLIDKTARTTEMAISTTTNSVNNFAETPGAGVACKRGDRLRVRIFGDDSAAATMAAGFTFGIGFDGPTASVNGDTWVQLTENLTFVSEPAGTTIYPTDTASAVDVSASVAGLLSAFIGSDEDPLSEGGNWAKLNTAVAGTLTRTSNTVAASSATGDVASYWTPTNFGPDVEAYLTISTASGNNAWIFARIQGEGGSNTWDGYALQAASGGIFRLFRFTNGTATLIGPGDKSVTQASGDTIGIACHGSVIEGWHKPSGGSWRLVETAVDTTYASTGKVGFGSAGGTGSRFDDFYAGTASYTFQAGDTEREAWTSRGAGVQTDVTNTTAGYTAPIQVTDTAGGTVVDWFTEQLTAFTLGGAVRVNARGLESNAAAQAVIRCEVARVAADGTSPTVWGATSFGTELGTSEAAQSFLVGGDDLDVSDGQRLRLRFSIDDEAGAGGAMVSGHTVTLYYAGTSGGASGDTYLTFTQTLTEYVAAGTVPRGRPQMPQIIVQ